MAQPAGRQDQGASGAARLAALTRGLEQSMNIADNLARSAQFFPDRPALARNGQETSYARLNDQASRIAGGLIALGLKPGERVGLCAVNSPDWLAFYFGIARAGGLAITLSNQLTGPELSRLLGHARPRFLMTDPERLGDLAWAREEGLEQVICASGDLDLDRLLTLGQPLPRAVDRDRHDPAAVLYTGGTTGAPKGVMLSHGNICAAAFNVVFNERSNEKDRALCFLPLNHVFGQIHIMNATIASGGCLELLPAYDPDRVLELIAAGRVTKLYAVPTVYARLLGLEDLRGRLANLRYCFSAASSMAAEIVRQWQERSGLTIHEAYGMTETASLVTFNHMHRHVVGSVGQPGAGVEVRIRDDQGRQVPPGRPGEVCIQGPNVMLGYLDNAQATAETFWPGGWLRSGDVGRIDEDGYLFLVDRLKDLIITGGENVYPREVEEVIHLRPEVQECAVVGMPHPEWGEAITALVVVRPGRDLSAEALKAHLKAHLSPFKVPKNFAFVDELPKSPAGKILKREVVRRLSDG